ncbi:MAG: hypothetical protein IT447_05375 [Phycisphaerales bacterium]|jgi:hypothetical protein|nr:hypothetical protein [Phycisphaerales bacterium]
MANRSRSFIESLESRVLLSRADLILGDRLQLQSARDQLTADTQTRAATLQQDRINIVNAWHNMPTARLAAINAFNSHVSARNTQLGNDQQAILNARTSGLAKVNIAIEAVRAAAGNPAALATAQQQLALERATMTAQLRSLSATYRSHAASWRSTLASDQHTMALFTRGGSAVINANEQYKSDWSRFREILRVDRRNVSIAFARLQFHLGNG